MGIWITALACEGYEDDMPQISVSESNKEPPHAEGPMIPSIDASEYVVEIDEDGAVRGTAIVRLYLNQGTIDPRLDEVALTMFHTRSSHDRILHDRALDGWALEWILTDHEEIFEGEWTDDNEAIDADGICGDKGGRVYCDPMKVHPGFESPTDVSEAPVSVEEMMGCDTADVSAGTDLLTNMVTIALLLGLMRHRLSMSGTRCALHIRLFHRRTAQSTSGCSLLE